MHYVELLDDFVKACRGALGDKLTGVYLHGSMAMGCFNPAKSDIDIIIIVESAMSDGEKLRLLKDFLRLNESAPQKGLEISAVRREFCRPFVYPTPFELHFSPMYAQKIRENPEEYIAFKGVDRDLAAHFTIINHYGKLLWGKPIGDVFGKVPRCDYLDSIRFDVENAREDIIENPMYTILNLCRVLAFAREGLCLSKKDGGQWGLKNVPGEYHDLIARALCHYTSDAPMGVPGDIGEKLASYMLAQIACAAGDEWR